MARAPKRISTLCVVVLACGCGDHGSSSGVEDAGSDAGVSDAGDDRDAGQRNVCGAITTAGRCAAPDLVELCVIPSGGGGPYVGNHKCLEGEICEETATGARCVLAANCAEGATQCTATDTLAVCMDGDFRSTTCAAGCISAALGAGCKSNVATQPLSATLEYEVRSPKADLSDWDSATTLQNAQELLVISYHGTDLLDAQYTASDGSFTIEVAVAPSADDRVVFIAARADAQGRLLYAVVDPGYSASNQPRGSGLAVPLANVWAWSYARADLSDGARLRIGTREGSGALFVHDTLRGVFTRAAAVYPDVEPASLVMWLGVGTAWDCGACTAKLPVNALGATFDFQMWLDGSAADQGYWSDAVSAHELGHYVMAAYGYELGEGGPHYIGLPTNPGQAWNEGWATYFSSDYRANPVYYDKQLGAFFWLDLDARQYAFDDAPWIRPSAADGLEQLIDENEVAAMLRKLALSLGDGTPLLQQIASERMTAGPFERSYTLRVWQNAARPDKFVETQIPLPYHADFFDALLCSGTVDATALDLITEPEVHYPYPSTHPLCR